MTYTSHGHHILGTVMDERRPEKVARCGGPALCKVCGREAAMVRHPASGNTQIEDLAVSQIVKELNDKPVVYDGQSIGRITSVSSTDEGIFVEFTVPHSVIMAHPGLFDSPLSGISVEEILAPDVIEDDIPMKTARRDPSRAEELRRNMAEGRVHIFHQDPYDLPSPESDS